MTKPLDGHSYSNLRGEGEASPKYKLKTKMTQNHPGGGHPPNGPYKERARGGTDVPVPPELNLP